ncbi:MAG: hypothetical protein AAF460_08810 [Pseudomonadota bacterium]
MNLLDAQLAQEPVTLAQLNSLIAGQAWKDDARVASTANVNIAAPGATVDGITMATDDRVLLVGQTDPAENGLYLWQGAAAAMVRAPDGAAFDDYSGAYVPVSEGTNAGNVYMQTAAAGGTIGTTALNWAQFGAAAPNASTTIAGIVRLATLAERAAPAGVTGAVPTLDDLWSGGVFVRRVSQLFGDGTSTSFAITHNLGNPEPQVAVQVAATRQGVDIEYSTDAAGNTTTFVTSAPVAANELRAVIHG